jgi:hypothetical protein
VGDAACLLIFQRRRWAYRKWLMELQTIKDARAKKPVINTAQIAYITHETDKGIVVTIYFGGGEKIELYGQPGESFVQAAQQAHSDNSISA